MILSFPSVGFEARLEENVPIIINIESPQAYRAFIYNIWSQIEGKTGEIVLYDNNKNILLNKAADIIFNPYEIDCNSKKVVSKIYQNCNEIAVTEMLNATIQLNSQISQYLEELTDVIPFQLDCQQELDVVGLLKLYDVKVRNDCVELTEQIMQYIKLMHQICNVKIFFFVHLKDYLSSEEIKMLYEASAYEKVHLVLIENGKNKIVNVEKNWIIDKDLCIIEL